MDNGYLFRAMLGTLPEQTRTHAPAGSPANDFIRTVSASPHAQRIGRAMSDRVLSELEGVVRGGRRSSYARKAVITGFWLMALKIFGALLLFWFMSNEISNVLKRLSAPRASTVQGTPTGRLPEPTGQAPNVMDIPADLASGRVSEPSTQGPTYRQPTSAEIRESQRRAEEAMRIIEANTPEM